MWLCHSEIFIPEHLTKIKIQTNKTHFHLRSWYTRKSESSAESMRIRGKSAFLLGWHFVSWICHLVSKETNNICLIFLFFFSCFPFKTILFPYQSQFLLPFSVLNIRFLMKKLIGKNILKMSVFIKYEKKRQFPCFWCLKAIWECLWLQTTRRIYCYYFSTPWSQHKWAN